MRRDEIDEIEDAATPVDGAEYSRWLFVQYHHSALRLRCNLSHIQMSLRMDAVGRGAGSAAEAHGMYLHLFLPAALWNAFYGKAAGGTSDGLRRLSLVVDYVI